MSEYCDWLDVSKDLCPTCLAGETHKVGHTPGWSQPPNRQRFGSIFGASDAGPVFELRWGSECGGCGTWMSEGSQARMRNGKPVHPDEEQCG